MKDGEIIKILSEAWDASKGTVQTRLTRGERLAVEMWLDGSALEAAVQEVHEMKRERKKLCGEEEE